MSDVLTRIEGHAGRITLNRPKALNALTYDMCMSIEAAIDDWRDNDAVKLIIIDAEGEKAFCAGGDIADIYAAGKREEFDYPRKFWRDEYRMNAKLAEYPKPVVSFMQGFVMGGGVGVGGHVSHRIVGDTTKIAMPECGIGLIPDVGGTRLLALAPRHLGEFLGLTGDRMGAGDAIYAGFADTYIAEKDWDGLKAMLIETGDIEAIAHTAQPVPESTLREWQDAIDAVFGGDSMADIAERLSHASTDAALKAQAAFAKNSPLAMTSTLWLVRECRKNPDIRNALQLEYRFTSRSLELADLIEGVRAAIIDKDRNPQWMHTDVFEVPADLVAQLLAPVDGPDVTF
ncbi:MAG: enoyl-CoA hydratase/isomerase family protein [Marivivens sp.]|uniref:enoyl-CoA hydratase/isomerase family protein n=1 Tax=Marivivens sp. TaxID=1978374 RepID=UPI00180E811E|nr:enoyl-CoA hydratase/isomerase family protein [Marivivens sp.]NVJ95099.1 enoyl-CoA hydratase/isomerase family protein [Marivivens sp.]